MLNKHRMKHLESDERRQTPDRRNGFDRRMYSVQDLENNNILFSTQEACFYLKVSRPTFLKYITTGKIKARKIGRGWKVFKDELDKFIRGEQ